MNVRPVDPRDDVDTEVDHPVYRVYFWERRPYPGVPIEQAGFTSYEHEITGAGHVREVIEWAETNAGPNRTFTLYVLVDQCLVRLLGHDPTSND